ncbi:MAG: hypothetical protein NT171_00485 [Planctomycetota bacterium]|nr:hypothetical protein [Planctomycetota bacterium]
MPSNNQTINGQVPCRARSSPYRSRMKSVTVFRTSAAPSAFQSRSLSGTKTGSTGGRTPAERDSGSASRRTNWRRNDDFPCPASPATTARPIRESPMTAAISSTVIARFGVSSDEP